MKADTSRNSFDPTNHYNRVVMQQGRVLLDADWNENASILLHFMQTFAHDLIGPYGTPKGPPTNGLGFEINGADDIEVDEERARVAAAAVAANTPVTDPPRIPHLVKRPADELGKGDFYIDIGRQYVAGRILENEQLYQYLRQPGYQPPEPLKNTSSYLVYLDVREQVETFINNPDISDPALRLVDVSQRSKMVWRVKAREVTTATDSETHDEVVGAHDHTKVKTKDTGVQVLDLTLIEENLTENEERNPVTHIHNGFRAFLDEERLAFFEDTAQTIPLPPAQMTAELPRKDPNTGGVGEVGTYLGSENQHYRVEIHSVEFNADKIRRATFKWSRENGSVIFPITEPIAENDESVKIRLSTRDPRFQLEPGNWVEIIDDDYVNAGALDRPLFEVDAVEIAGDEAIVRLANPRLAADVPQTLSLKAPLDAHPYLRRWDHTAKRNSDSNTTSHNGAIIINWPELQELEDGIWVQFERPGNSEQYRRGKLIQGDYWSLPARSLQATQRWQDQPMPPNRPFHDFAPLAVVSVDAEGKVDRVQDLRIGFELDIGALTAAR